MKVDISSFTNWELCVLVGIWLNAVVNVEFVVTDVDLTDLAEGHLPGGDCVSGHEYEGGGKCLSEHC